MQKLWKTKPRTKQNLIEQLLANRGLESPDQIQNFLNPDYAGLHDPFLFSDMRSAAERIWQAIKAGEQILIYSDYDADAITANALVFRTLKLLGAKASVYIPDRFSEGYGLNLEAFKKIKKQGVAVVITVDCGTNSVAEAEYCKKHGIDLIITDHHELTGDLPQASALINPKLPDNSYPYREITGVGVAFKLACALFSYNDKHDFPAGFEKWFLDLVAIGTVADCHSLLGENRILVKFGLKVLAKTKWIGLAQLLRTSGLEQKASAHALDAYALGFIIAPRINAAGRIEHASTAFDLLATDDFDRARQLALELEQLNSRRQMLTENVMSEARAQLTEISERKVLLAAGNDWPKGVVGLVAGKLAEEFAKPVLVLERGELESTGSARSISGFNLVEALNYSKDFLVKYGGHAAAAGFTLRTEHLDVFYKNLLDYAETRLSEQQLVRIVEIEAEVRPEEINMQNLELLQNFDPYGMDNPRPKLLLRGAIISEMNFVGREQQHVQLTIAAGGRFLKCIAFNFGNSARSLVLGDVIDLVFELMYDSWNGNVHIKLKVVDLRKAQDGGI